MRKVRYIESHTAGEPLRVLLDGVPPIPGATMLEKRAWMRANADEIRTALMWEPRGHADMYGCVLTEPVAPGGDFGVLFLHNEGYSTMCGHAVIALTTVLLQEGLVPREKVELRYDTPAGRVLARARWAGDAIESVRFENVPSFVLASDVAVETAESGPAVLDIAYGGAFYALVPAGPFGLSLVPGEVPRLQALDRALRRAATATVRIAHPEAEDLGFLYGTIFYGPPQDPARHSRNVCVFADGEVDRSPTGTGVSARAAQLLARGDLEFGVRLEIESILGSTLSVTALRGAAVGRYPAVVPEVAGRAFVLGRGEAYLDPRDELGRGFLLR